jgi:hypothetical protein
MTATEFLALRRRLNHIQTRLVLFLVDNRSTDRAHKVNGLVDQTNGRLRPFGLPTYISQLNQDEVGWRHMKNHQVGGDAVNGFAIFRNLFSVCYVDYTSCR